MKTQARRINLHDELKRPRFNHAVILTYTFSPRFFEDYCLERFNSLKENGNVSVLLDRDVHEHILAAGTGTETGDFPSKGNVRYLLHPVSVPGRFHPKLFLFANKKRGLLVIGSANFTRDGIASNAEMVNCYDFALEEEEAHKPLFQQAFQYVQQLALVFPSRHFDSNLSAMRAEASWLVQEDAGVQAPSPHLLNNLDASLWSQLVSAVKGPVDCLHVLSRFFDSSPALLDAATADLRPKKIKIYTQNSLTTMTKAWLEHPLFQQGKLEIYSCRFADAGHPQPLHAKAIAVETSSSMALAFGSANFTSSALLRKAHQGNVELLLHYPDLPKRSVQVEKVFDPQQTATRLWHPEDLETAEKEELENKLQRFGFRLEEAWVQDDKLLFRSDIPSEFAERTVKGKILAPNRRPKEVTFTKAPSGDYRCELSGDLESQLRTTANTLQIYLEAGGQKVAESNPVLIANLQDIRTGRNLRRERHIQEALQSAGRFISVLRELSGSEDDEALLKFLTYCDIPIISNLRGLRPPRDSQGTGPSTEEMRNLGERNLRFFKGLHEAVIHFVERHTRRLARHVDGGTAQGIPNFMHILLANAGLLHSQIQRACYGFAARETPLTPDEWFTFRSCLDQYYTLFGELFHLFAEEYVPAVLKNSTVKKVKEGFGDDLETLAKLEQEIIQSRGTIDGLRVQRLRVQGNTSQLVVPPYFNSVMSEGKWGGYVHEINGLNAQLHRAIA